MKQPLMKLSLLAFLPVFLHTFVPMQVWWPAISYSIAYQRAAQERTVGLNDLTLEIAGEATAVLMNQQTLHIFSGRRYTKLQALQKEGRAPDFVTVYCKQDVCAAQPSDAHFATFLVTFSALFLAFVMIFGVRIGPSYGGTSDMGLPDCEN
ncbi:hypothetical protein ACMG4P_05990 [Pseudovibrio denitrificans]|uniref:hypothetical protein n=1 Tax=Pseudovibrio denitrificans TaxID=258256 RepID=UPI0039BF95DC